MIGERLADLGQIEMAAHHHQHGRLGSFIGA